MGNLAGHFPAGFRRDYVYGKLVPGVVLYLSCEFTNPPKKKYLVLANWDPEPLLFCINSKIHKYLSDRPWLLRAQIKMGPADYDFLDHDSYIDCAQVIEDMSSEEIIAQLIQNPSLIRGSLLPHTVQYVRGAVQAASTVSGRNKRLILRSLT